MRVARLAVCLTCVWTAVAAIDLPAADWTQWRGSQRDARVADGPSQWPRTLKSKWKLAVGEGHSSPIVADGKVFIHARQQDDEVVRCLELSTGKVVWTKQYAAPYKMHSAARGHGKGPKSTPVVADGKLVTFGISGILSCFEAKTGRQLWQKEFSKQFAKTSPLYGTAMSPLVHQGKVFAHVGGHNKGALTAFDLADGSIAWSWNEDGPGYTSPILVRLGGAEQIVTQSQSHIVSVSPGTGKLLWKLPFKTDYDQNCITPINHKQSLIFSGYGQPTAAYQLSKQGTQWQTAKAWSNADIPCYMSTPVISGNLLFGMTHRRAGQLFCADAVSGKVHWTGKGRLGKNAVLIAVGDAVLVLATNGQLRVIQSAAGGMKELAKYKVTDKATWAHPAVVGNRILIKDFDSLVCLSAGE